MKRSNGRSQGGGREAEGGRRKAGGEGGGLPIANGRADRNIFVFLLVNSL
jgi:hypothetical protein